jgi:hypothetical protein
MNPSFRGIIFAALLAGGLQSHAQEFQRTFERVVWEGPRVARLMEAHKRPVAQLFDQEGRLLQKIAPPSAGTPFGKIHFVDESFLWVTSPRRITTPDGPREEVEVFALSAQGGWARIGRLEQRWVPDLVPLGDGRFLGITPTPLVIQQAGRSYPFGIYKASEDGKLVLDRTEDLGLGKPAFQSNGQRNFPFIVMSFIKGSTMLTPEHLTLVSESGIFWVFERNRGRLARVVRLYNGLTDERLAKANLPRLLLGFQSAPEGHLLISAIGEGPLSEDSTSPRQPLGKVHPPPSSRAWANDRVEMHPVVYWWNLDPLTGKKSEVAAPEAMPRLVMSAKDVVDFDWRFSPSGKVLPVAREERETAAPEAAASFTKAMH